MSPASLPGWSQQRGHALTAGLRAPRQDPNPQSKPLPLPPTAFSSRKPPDLWDCPPHPPPCTCAGGCLHGQTPQTPAHEGQSDRDQHLRVPLCGSGGCGHFLTHQDSTALPCEDAELSGSSWAHLCGPTFLAGALTPGCLTLACLGARGLCSQRHERPGCLHPTSLSLADVRDSLPSLRGQQRSRALLPQR